MFGENGLYPVLRPQQPVRPFWMGDDQNNLHWEMVQGDCLCYFIELFCNCPMTPDITDWVFQFTVKESLDPLDPNTLFKVVWNAQHGACAWTCLIVLPKNTLQVWPGSYAFDLKSQTPGGLVTTFARGQLDILPSSDLSLSQENTTVNPLSQATVQAAQALAL